MHEIKNLLEVFKGGGAPKQDNIIEAVKIDWLEHSKGVYNIAKALEPNYVLTEQNKELFKNLLLYFTGDQKSIYDLNKGIALFGGVGTGKTLLFEIFRLYTSTVNRKNSYRTYTAQELVSNAESFGVEALANFGTLSTNTAAVCYLDDIASGNEQINHFGTKLNVIEKLLTMRYDVYRKHRKLTHLSSNKYPLELTDIYGERVADRLKELCNIVELRGSSFRK